MSLVRLFTWFLAVVSLLYSYNLHPEYFKFREGYLFGLTYSVLRSTDRIYLWFCLDSTLLGKMADFVWSEEKEELLIEMWRDRQSLYNVSLPAYHNKHTKSKKLEEIRKAIGCNCEY